MFVGQIVMAPVRLVGYSDKENVWGVAADCGDSTYANDLYSVGQFIATDKYGDTEMAVVGVRNLLVARKGSKLHNVYFPEREETLLDWIKTWLNQGCTISQEPIVCLAAGVK